MSSRVTLRGCRYTFHCPRGCGRPPPPAVRPRIGESTVSYIDPVTSGQSLRWVRITDSGEHATQIRWENRGWVVETIASDVRAEFAVRANAACFAISQSRTSGSERMGPAGGARSTVRTGRISTDVWTLRLPSHL